MALAASLYDSLYDYSAPAADTGTSRGITGSNYITNPASILLRIA